MYNSDEKKSLFENPGEKIENISKVLFWITVILSVILAFVLGWSKEYHYSTYGGYYEKEFHPVYFWSLLIGYPLVAYVSTLFLVSFGEMVQNVQNIEYIAEKIRDKTK